MCERIWSLWREALDSANACLEFGCGLSTEFVSQNYKCRNRSVETSPEWVNHVRKQVPTEVEVIHVDLGPVGEWGRPLTYNFHDRFIKYFESGFDGDYRPDVILIDGRFRVACFLTSLLLSTPGTKIVIDDYPRQPQYHVVEQILAPASISSRQALFIRPQKIDRQRIHALRESFVNVMD